MAKQSKKLPGSPVITDEVRKVADIRPDPRNAKKHSESQIAQIVQSIERFGFVEKLVIRPNGQLISGEGRLEALKRVGREQVECRVVSGLNEAGYKALGLALNRIGENSRWDEDVLREILGELQGEGENPLSLGFSPTELDKILAEPRGTWRCARSRQVPSTTSSGFRFAARFSVARSDWRQQDWYVGGRQGGRHHGSEWRNRRGDGASPRRKRS
jgi:ParB-like chromosome segregation protein Spo0J